MWKLQAKRDAYEAFKNAEKDDGDNFIYFPDCDIDADKEAKHPELFVKKEDCVPVKVLCGADKVINTYFAPSAKIEAVADEIGDLTEIPKDGFRLIHPSTKKPYDLDFAIQDCDAFDPDDGLTVRIELRLKGGGALGVKKPQFAKKEDAMKGLKKRLRAMREPDEELDHSMEGMPEAFGACVQGFNNQLTEFLALKATSGSSFIGLCLKHISMENLKALEKIYAKGKGGKHLTAEERAIRTVEMIYPALEVMTKMSEKLDFVKATHMAKLVELYAEEYGAFNEQTGTVSLNCDAFSQKLKLEIDRREDSTRPRVNTEAVETSCTLQ
eukprot:Skav223203  [mRNA]  locus=scaffold1624:79193:80170:+ [translate_table: standard]